MDIVLLVGVISFLIGIVVLSSNSSKSVPGIFFDLTDKQYWITRFCGGFFKDTNKKSKKSMREFKSNYNLICDINSYIDLKYGTKISLFPRG